MKAVLACALLACSLVCAEADPLAGALALADGDGFASDRMQQALSSAPVGKRKPLVERLAKTGRDDVLAVLHRMIQDDDPQAAAAAINALAARWPTCMQDVELIRTLIPASGPASDEACAYAATVNDDEALPALVHRAAIRTNDQPSERALRKLLNLPGGVGPEGWAAAVENEQQRYDAALSNAEKLLDGSALDGIAAITLVAGLRPIGSRATQVLLRAAEHPDQTVRNAARSVLTTCPTPAAAAWRKQAEANRVPADTGPGAAQIGPSPALTTASARPQPAAKSQSATPTAPARPTSGWMVPLLLCCAATAGAVIWFLLKRRPQSAATPTTKPEEKRITWAR